MIQALIVSQMALAFAVVGHLWWHLKQGGKP